MATELRDIIGMLEQEQDKWKTSSTTTQTWQEISRCTGALYLLLELLEEEEEDVSAFVCAMKQHSISLKRLRACFRTRPGVEDSSYRKRILVTHLFNTMCNKMIGAIPASDTA